MKLLDIVGQLVPVQDIEGRHTSSSDSRSLAPHPYCLMIGKAPHFLSQLAKRHVALLKDPNGIAAHFRIYYVNLDNYPLIVS